MLTFEVCCEYHDITILYNTITPGELRSNETLYYCQLSGGFIVVAAFVVLIFVFIDPVITVLLFLLLTV